MALRSPETPVLALTATATKEVRKDVKSLGLCEDRVEITVSPNRTNIFLYTAKVSDKISESFAWLVEKLRKEGVQMQQTIVYCKCLKDCGGWFKYFKFILGENACHPCDAEHSSKNCLITQFHYSTLQKHKNRVTESFQNCGKSRLVFSTNPLGIGVNFKKIRTVVHYGPPRYIEDFVQEIGRAGRDKQPALTLLLYSGTQLRKCDKQMKACAESRVTCLRKLLLEQFQDGDMPPEMLPHSYCMNCHRKCHCIEPEQCRVPLHMYSAMGNLNHEGPAETARIRKTTQDQKTLLKELLIDYQTSLTSA